MANRKEDSGFFILSTLTQCAKRATCGGLKRNLQGLYDTGLFSLTSPENRPLAKFYLRAFLILTTILFLIFLCTAKSQASITHFSQKEFTCTGLALLVLMTRTARGSSISALATSATTLRTMGIMSGLSVPASD